MLDREEYVEQAHFFQVLAERIPENVPMQDLLGHVKLEVLSTTKLPMAIDFLLAELKHAGTLSTAMSRLAHYFTPYQTYIMGAAEDDRGRFDIRVAVDVLRCEAEYRSRAPTPQGVFLYQFETLCRNRLKYDRGLDAIAKDPIYNDDWREWIYTVRRQVGLVDFSELLYVRSQHYQDTRVRREGSELPPEKPILFGEREGKIALANHQKDPLYLFAALQRQLDYPPAPRPKRVDETQQMLPQILRRLERMEARLKMLEEEERLGSIDLKKFYTQPDQPSE